MEREETVAQHPGGRRPATVQDVARAAGVSKATAARALGNYGSVSPSVLRRVTAAAEALGYRPNELARSVTTGRSHTLGVIVGDIENPYFGLAVRGITDAARAAGFDVLLANTSEDVTFEVDAVRVMLDRRVDGLLVAPARSDRAEHLRQAHAMRRPLVLLDRRVLDLPVDTVTVDNTAAASEMVRHLVGLGHRRIAFLSASDPETAPISSVADRITGFVSALADARVADPGRDVRLGARGPEAAARIVRELLARPDRPTALIASDSLVALSVLRTVRDVGLAVPDEVSLVTFDDSDWTSVTTPPITVISQPIYGLGAEAARILVRRIDGDTAGDRERVFSATIVHRGSVGRPPIG
jgi:LacI family transcriptional regulator